MAYAEQILTPVFYDVIRTEEMEDTPQMRGDTGYGL
jgi:hypothetical protein